jgi:hypothetical protein
VKEFVTGIARNLNSVGSDSRTDSSRPVASTISVATTSETTDATSSSFDGAH